MRIKKDILDLIENKLNEHISDIKRISGGSIADAYQLTSSTQQKYFLKTMSYPSDMFKKEANSLKELEKPNTLRVAKVISFGDEYLLTEYITAGNKTDNFFSSFGRDFAKLHKYTSDKIGFYEDNYIGSTVQHNSSTIKQSWPEFYFQKRLLPQLKLAEKNNYSTKELRTLISQLENKIDSILGQQNDKVSLLHGDLWYGNFICDSEGKAVLIDPAVYYGNREADLAMTKMFGGFNSEFYRAYNEEFPLEKGWEYREGIYLLYHYLNHLNLFGSSYYPEVISILKEYV